jgi:hypothetical protein
MQDQLDAFLIRTFESPLKMLENRIGLIGTLGPIDPRTIRELEGYIDRMNIVKKQLTELVDSKIKT